LLKAYPDAAIAVRVTTVPDAYTAWEGDTTTFPPLEGEAWTVSVYVGPAIKFAVTVLFPFIVTVVGLVAPTASPVQLLKAYPDAAVAESVTTVPDAYSDWEGDTATVPPPEGEAWTVSVYFVVGGVDELPPTPQAT
jgi:hypothetical protein